MFAKKEDGQPLPGSTRGICTQFALIQMNMGGEVCRQLPEANDRLFRAGMGVWAK
jgi:hypothetical protein